MLFYIVAYSCSRPLDKLNNSLNGSIGMAMPSHISNGHAPLRHTTSYDETYASPSNLLHPSHITHSPAVSQHQLMNPLTLGQGFDNSEYYAHCHEQKYKPPPQHLDMSKLSKVVQNYKTFCKSMMYIYIIPFRKSPSQWF